MPSVLPDYRAHDAEIAKLLGLAGTLGNLSPVYQKLIAEIVLLRLFSLFENLVSAVSLKLASGATYADGTAPGLFQGLDPRNKRGCCWKHRDVRADGISSNGQKQPRSRKTSAMSWIRMTIWWWSLTATDPSSTKCDGCETGLHTIIAIREAITGTSSEGTMVRT